MHLAEPTVRGHFGRILSKLELRDRGQAVIFAYEAWLFWPRAARVPLRRVRQDGVSDRWRGVGMGYDLHAVIAGREVLRAASRDLPAARVTSLGQGLSLMPM